MVAYGGLVMGLKERLLGYPGCSGGRGGLGFSLDGVGGWSVPLFGRCVNLNV